MFRWHCFSSNAYPSNAITAIALLASHAIAVDRLTARANLPSNTMGAIGNDTLVAGSIMVCIGAGYCCSYDSTSLSRVIAPMVAFACWTILPWTNVSMDAVF